ncbi:hypothetical protein R3P38DRAFT_3410795 [Favolaschia claudopus]|uniref:Uncharacterized protein n=1 Tax=Favolaschia claudopus TaxID=2862362 RepID=A0AAV9ZHR0_9AGAR
MNGIHWIDTQTRDAFDTNLRRFLRNTFTDENLRDDGLDLCIRPYKCMYIDFTSLEDFTGKCDVLRCNPDFQVNHEERFDFVNVNMDQNSLSFARVLYLFRCVLPSHREEDIALVRSLKASRWKPNTLYFVRGAHMINAFGCRNERSTYYLNDVVDGDWFLRAEN